MTRRPSEHPVQQWHTIVKARDPSLLDAFLAEDVTFYSPVVHTPQEGKWITAAYLSAALHVFGNETFQYVRQIVGERDAVLEFTLEIDGIHINGVDLLRWNDAGQLVEFKVMLRPLKAVHLIHEKMKAMLEKMAPKG